MPPKTPTLTSSTTGYTRPGHTVFTGVNPVTTALKSVGADAKQQGMALEVYYFADVDDTDTWASGIQNIRAVAWQADQADTDKVGATITAQATGTITFDAENANSTGWLWVLRG